MTNRRMRLRSAADVVAAFPESAHGVATMWTEDYARKMVEYGRELLRGGGENASGGEAGAGGSDPRHGHGHVDPV